MNVRSSAIRIPSAFLLLTVFGCFAAETKVVNPAEKEISGVKTHFIDDARLNNEELVQVLTLARQCGITNIAEVETFYRLPGRERGIRVNSEERVAGRNISFDSVAIYKLGWIVADPGKGVTRIGEFRVDEPKKCTTLLRTYEINGSPARVIIEEGVEVAFADKVIPLILSKRVRFENDSVQREFEQKKDARPYAISRYRMGQGYELRFAGMRSVIFKFRKGQVRITGISDPDV